MIVTGEPTQAFVDAVSARLKADVTLMALVTGGIHAQVSRAQRTTPPYLVLGRRHLDRNAGAMQRAGAMVSLQIDGWSEYAGPYEMARILSRVALLLERTETLTVTGFTYLEGSLTCEMSDVDWEQDPDAPEQGGAYRGIQRWAAEIHET